ncbi:hypothetical protein DPEC_G00197140 [Dallia pectoralis]|uniref:Uncharacterized protein n=1 Tax=Dallia pectoralis TaxID=75939 RepID=A0ACC2G7W3_DALPE|nr:hypothetical protein DPEC_G00197140 [Dallia pectoralis]
MGQRWIQTLVLLFFCQESLQENTQKDGQRVPIPCTLAKTGNLVIWFRVKENAGLKFIASINSNGSVKTDTSIFSTGIKKSLTINSFQTARDIGDYCCASIFGGDLMFGNVTQLTGEDSPSTTTTTTTNPTTTTIVPNSSTTAMACQLGKADPRSLCDLIVWAPLAAGCGLLFVILLVTGQEQNDAHIITKDSHKWEHRGCNSLQPITDQFDRHQTQRKRFKKVCYCFY